MSPPYISTYGPLGDVLCLASIVLTGALFVVWVIVMMIGAVDMANRQRDQYREVTERLNRACQRDEYRHASGVSSEVKP